MSLGVVYRIASVGVSAHAAAAVEMAPSQRATAIASLVPNSVSGRLCFAAEPKKQT
jgi:hypothetical protein